MATISTLTVKIVAETAKFTNGLKRSRRQSSQWANAVRKAMFGVGAATTAVAGSLALLTRQSLKTADAQQKIADRLGLTQTALSGLTLAAERTGATQKGLELALQRSTRRISEAATGTGTAVKALKELGIEAKSFARLSPDEQFIRLAGAFEQVTNQSDRVRLGFKLFDAEGVGLINTLRLGEDGLRGFIDEARALGVALDRTATRNIEDANDATNILKTAFRGLGNQIAAQVAPSLTAGATALANIVKSVVAAIPRIAALTRRFFGLRREVQQLTIVDIQEELKLAQADTLEAQGRLNDTLRELRKLSPNQQRAQILQAGGQTLEDLGNVKIARRELKLAEDRVNSLIRRLVELKREGAAPILPGLDVTGEAAGEAAGAGRRRNAGLLAGALGSVDAALGPALDQVRQWSVEADGYFDSTRTLVERFNIEVERIRSNPLIEPEVQQRAIADAGERLRAGLERINRDTQDASAQISEFGIQAARNLQTAFADFLFDPFEDGLKGMLNGFVNTLKRMVAEVLASQILTALFQSVGGTGGAAFASAAFGGGRALGGPVTGGTPYVVGERGPELFVPGANGRVLPNMGAQVTQVNNINVQGAITPDTLIPILDENNRRLRGQLLDDIDRGGL